MDSGEKWIPVQSSLHGKTKPRIAAEPELLVVSVQVRKPASKPASRENIMASEIAEGSSAHCNVADLRIWDCLRPRG